jgi:hypothetical protein
VGAVAAGAGAWAQREVAESRSAAVKRERMGFMAGKG